MSHVQGTSSRHKVLDGDTDAVKSQEVDGVMNNRRVTCRSLHHIHNFMRVIEGDEPTLPYASFVTSISLDEVRLL